MCRARRRAGWRAGPSRGPTRNPRVLGGAGAARARAREAAARASASEVGLSGRSFGCRGVAPCEPPRGAACGSCSAARPSPRSGRLLLRARAARAAMVVGSCHDSRGSCRTSGALAGIEKLRNLPVDIFSPYTRVSIGVLFKPWANFSISQKSYW